MEHNPLVYKPKVNCAAQYRRSDLFASLLILLPVPITQPTLPRPSRAQIDDLVAQLRVERDNASSSHAVPEAPAPVPNLDAEPSQPSAAPKSAAAKSGAPKSAAAKSGVPKSGVKRKRS